MRVGVLLGVPGALAAYLAYAAAGIAAGAAALIAVTLTLVLVAGVLGDEHSIERRTAERLTVVGLLLLSGVLTVCLSFLRGGYFADGMAFAAVVLV